MKIEKVLVCQVGKKYVELRRIEDNEVYYIVQSPNGQCNESDLDVAFNIFKEELDCLFLSL